MVVYGTKLHACGKPSADLSIIMTTTIASPLLQSALAAGRASVQGSRIVPKTNSSTHHEPVIIRTCTAVRGSRLISAENGRFSTTHDDVLVANSLDSGVLRCRRRRRGRNVVCASFRGDGGVGSNGVAGEKELAIVWFKHDLRLDDHPGVAAAAEYKQVLPLFVFDPSICSGWSKEHLKGLFDAVADLRRALRLLGSDLVVLTGRTTDVLIPFAQKIGATSIIAEEEIESGWQNVLNSVSDSLVVEVAGDNPTRLKQWSASLYDTQKVSVIPDSYKDFQRMGLRILAPLDAPTSLPALPKVTDLGFLPDFDEFTDSVDSIRGENPWWETLKAAQAQAAELLHPQRNGASRKSTVTVGQSGPLKGLMEWREKYILESPQASYMKKKGISEEVEVIGKFDIRGGAAGASNVLDGYLRFLEPTSRSDWQAVYEHIWEMEKKPGASFRTLFGNSLALGTLSRRRVLFEALKYERERNGGRLSPFGFSTFTVAAAVGDVKSMEWFELLQKKSQVQASERGFNIGAWRWRGYHIQYSVMGNEGPAVLLVHGFGAFWEHYRENLRGLAEKGYRVWALTLVGFGRSEKPDITYTELVWAELVRDFIVEVVQEPVVLAGNSIGVQERKVGASCNVHMYPITRSFTRGDIFGTFMGQRAIFCSLLYYAGTVDYGEGYGNPSLASIFLGAGFTTTIVAGLWPSLVSSLILLNTAGKVIPEYKGLTYNQPKKSSAIAKPVSRLLLLYLQSSSDRLLTQCYPKQASRVDDWLLSEVKRGSYDPGNTAVLESVFVLNSPLPLNFYLDRYTGHVLVIQGTRDPLQKNSKRAEMLQELCSNVTVKYLDAGHCPHDELPDEVNNLVHEFVQRRPERAPRADSPVTTVRENDDAPATAADILREEVKLISKDILTSPLDPKK